MNKKCQIFTPELICDKILDMADYKHDLYGKKILENSCGDGNILIKIVKRYIEDCLINGLSIKNIKDGLQNDIFAYEVDKKHKDNCIIQLNNLANNYGLNNINWNINKRDYLREVNDLKYDYIVGNPPYISYRDLDEETRKFIRETFKTCHFGKADYCYAFIEKSYDELKINGQFVYIIPNSIFKNKYAESVREYIYKDLIEVLDFKNNKVFPNAITASAIISIKKGINNHDIKYKIYSENIEYIIKKEKHIKKWDFDYEKVEKEFKFSNYFNCSVSIATLLNSVYVLKEFQEDKNYIYIKEQKIEKKILKNAISARNMCFSKKEKIVFPYFYKNNELIRFNEEELKKKFPFLYKYLNNNKEKLCKRTSDKSAKWFEYGRSQALRHLNQDKLLISTLITNKVKVYELTNEDIPYSGIYITKKNDLDLNVAKKILTSEIFLNYVYKIGINANGNSIRINPSNINEFSFSEEELEKWKN